MRRATWPMQMPGNCPAIFLIETVQNELVQNLTRVREGASQNTDWDRCSLMIKSSRTRPSSSTRVASDSRQVKQSDMTQFNAEHKSSIIDDVIHLPTTVIICLRVIKFKKSGYLTIDLGKRIFREKLDKE